MKNRNYDWWIYPFLGILFWYVVIHFIIKYW